MTYRPVDQATLDYRLRRDPHLVEIAECLGSVECWVVGGWVRDRALGREPPDLDLVVQGAEAAENTAGLLGTAWNSKPRLLGRPERAVWRLTGPRCKIEIWPMERDNLEADALRRDFTCNALFWRLPDGPFFDPTGGFEDITDLQIRAISRANLIIDPVRLLRGARLWATLDGFSMERQTRYWISDLAPTLADAPRERIGAELLTLAHAPRAAVGLQKAAALNLLAPASPRRSATADPFTAPLAALACLAGQSPHPAPASVAYSRPESVLAWLASGWPLSSPKNLAAFAWPRDVVQTVATAVSRLGEARACVDKGPADRRDFIARSGSAFPTVLALAAAIDSNEHWRPQPWRRWWRQWLRSGRRILESRPLLDASDITAETGIKPGPQLGQVLSDLERATVRRDVRSPAGARRWVRSKGRS